jgi:hypothetical protein
MPVSWAIRLYPKFLEIFSGLARGIDGRLLRLSAPHEALDIHSIDVRHEEKEK